jgi:hypothetical protein
MRAAENLMAIDFQPTPLELVTTGTDSIPTDTDYCQLRDLLEIGFPDLL